MNKRSAGVDAIGGLLAAAIVFGGCRMVGGDLERQVATTCASCHQEIAREWHGSVHASSWTNAAYVAAKEGRTDGKCLPCHAPRPVLLGSEAEPVVVRDQVREHGIDCVACHFDGQAYVGPYRSQGPHAMAQDTARLLASSVCARCHQTEALEHSALYRPTRREGAPSSTCADCHMPARDSRLTQGHLLSLAHPVRRVHDHSCSPWSESLAGKALDAATPTVERKNDGRLAVTVVVMNVGAGHRIPTGHFGHREVVLHVDLEDASGTPLGQGERSLLAENGEGLVPERPTEFTFLIAPPRPDRAAAVRLLVTRVNEDRSFRFRLLDRRWALP